MATQAELKKDFEKQAAKHVENGTNLGGANYKAPAPPPVNLSTGGRVPQKKNAFTNIGTVAAKTGAQMVNATPSANVPAVIPAAKASPVPTLDTKSERYKGQDLDQVLGNYNPKHIGSIILASKLSAASKHDAARRFKMDKDALGEQREQGRLDNEIARTGIMQQNADVNTDRLGFDRDKFSQEHALNQDKFGLDQDKFGLDEDRLSLDQDKYGLDEARNPALIDLDKARAENLRASAASEGLKGSDKSDKIKLKTGGSYTMDDLRELYESQNGTRDGQGNFVMDAGAPPLEAWINSQAVNPVFQDVQPRVTDQMRLDAEKYAKGIIDEKTGVFTTDAQDLPEYGGSRTKAIQALQNEYLQQQMAQRGITPQAAPSEPQASAPKESTDADGATVVQKKYDPQSTEHQQVFMSYLRKAGKDKDGQWNYAEAERLAKENGWEF